MTLTFKTTKRFAGLYTVRSASGSSATVEYCSQQDGWEFNGWMARSDDNPYAYYADPCATKAAAVEAAKDLITSYDNRLKA